jgi:hypothetical protein
VNANAVQPVSSAWVVCKAVGRFRQEPASRMRRKVQDSQLWLLSALEG